MSYALTAINMLQAQIIFDFESGTLELWEQVPVNRWEISGTETIAGTGTLHHAFDNTEGGRDAISTSLYPLQPDSGATTWRFQVKHGYNPSGSNNWGVFLFADASAEMMAPVNAINGYVVGVNYSGTDDIIKLWEVTNGIAEEIINSGINWQTSVGTSTPAGIEVVRSEAGEWQLSIDTSGGFDNLITSGTAITNQYNSAIHFGVSFEYSSTQDQQLWIDDISIDGAFVPDETPPQIEKIEVIDSTQLTVYFSEAIDTSMVTQNDNYLLNGRSIPANVTVEENNMASLSFTTSFPEGDSSILSIAGITDIHGNMATNLSVKFLYFTVKPGNVVINEIMADPSPPVDLPESEFVELYNATGYAINLEDWKIAAGGTEKSLPKYLLKPNEYVILTQIDAIQEFEIDALGIFTTSASLTNSGSTIRLMNDKDKIIDEVSYRNTWYNDDTKSSGGWSLERIDPTNTCLAEENWSASQNTSGGTPGAVNSIRSDLTDTIAPYLVNWNFEDDRNLILNFSEAIKDNFNPAFFKTKEGFNLLKVERFLKEDIIRLTFSNPVPQDSIFNLEVTSLQDRCGNSIQDTTLHLVYHLPTKGDIIINEIMADPDPLQGLPEVEYVELYNRSAYPLSLNNWHFEAGSTMKSFPECIMPAGSYLIITHEEFTDLFAEYGNAIGMFTSTSTLTNSGSQISVLSSDSTLINQVNYSDSWYKDPEKASGGWSLERIDPDNLCSGGMNWKASENIAGGTPGSQNSVFRSNPDTLAPAITSALATSYHQMVIRFSESLADSVLLQKSHYKVSSGETFDIEIYPDEDFSVSLNFTDSLKGEITLTVSGIADRCGNEMADTSVQLYLFPGEPYHVIISEIMANPTPSVQLPEVEYLELYNRTTHPLQLNDWIITTGTSERLLPPSVLQPGEYKILCDISNAWYFAQEKVIGIEGFNTLSNSGTTLVLSDKSGRTIHAVHYKNTWFDDEFKMNGGWSLEMIDTDNPCGGDENWTASEDENGGTPGESNSVQASNPDQRIPELVRVGFKDDSTLIAFFSEPMDSATLVNNASYTLSPSLNETPSIIPVAPFFDHILLQYQQSFEQGVIYTVSISGNIADCAGNPTLQTKEISFSVPEAADTFDIVINEILFNPSPEGSDYVELYNRSEKTIDLQVLLIASFDENTYSYSPSYYIKDQSFLFAPGVYVVLTQNANWIKQHYNVPEALQYNIIDLENLPSFPDKEGRVALLTNSGKVIDDFAYSEDMHFPLLDITEGISLERIHPDRSTNSSDNWHSAAQTAGYGTPGRQNSQFSENLLPKEETFVLTPEIFTPDNDGIDDIAKLTYNLSKSGYVANIAVYDAAGRMISNIARNYLLGASGTLTWDGTRTEGTRCPPGIYLFYIEIFHPDGEVQQYKKSVVLSYRR